MNKPSMPITVTPYDHQRRAFEFVCGLFGLEDGRLRSRGAALLMEMGCGKTITSVAVAGALYCAGRAAKVLVVAPLSVLGTWESEFEKFAAFPYTLTILKGPNVKKRNN